MTAAIATPGRREPGWFVEGRPVDAWPPLPADGDDGELASVLDVIQWFVILATERIAALERARPPADPAHLASLARATERARRLYRRLLTAAGPE